ncbi:DRTGG domain-containing protein [Caloramator quimbayensis]|uniref:DRTGG domain-containing protein n=1 Tax=Caloramator quimbayensis TaxID=1147123 RepID=A0A1T4X4C9_9CLOT|nr:AraC family transcriptional regulator [Caloramator quimbayensis]SKA83711.1 DRTGG domain-containing protein [Caloramator quimbayensis]
MKVSDLVEKLNLKVVSGFGGIEKEVKGVYTCDLLSWVMSHAVKGNAWITVQVHPNIIAVASLLELSCIIIPEDIEIEDVTLEKSNQEAIPVIKSSMNSYELCLKLSQIGV